MALPILDGNQSATTLSTILSGGEHTPAHTVVSLGSTAISNITSAVSGSVVSISNFPATQTIAGTVTANVLNATVQSVSAVLDGDGNTFGIDRDFPVSGTVTANESTKVTPALGGSYGGGDNYPAGTKILPVGGWTNEEDGAHWQALKLTDSGNLYVNVDNFPASTAISGAVTIGSLPAISGTVTVNTNLNAPDLQTLANLTLVSDFTNNIGPLDALWAGVNSKQLETATIPANAVKGRAFLVTVKNDDLNQNNFFFQGQFHGPGTKAGDFYGTSNYFTVNGATPGFNTESISVPATSTTHSYLFCAGFSNATTGNGSLLLETLPFDLNFSLTGTGINGAVATVKIYKVPLPNELYLPSIIGGNLRNWLSSPVATVTVGNSVTIGSLPTLTPQLPRVTFIDGSGTVVTANSAVTLFASSSTRSYLLVQVTTGSAFVNVGATATTVNGISLTAGQGYAWETTIPQGAVSLISTTTNSAYVAKQA